LARSNGSGWMLGLCHLPVAGGTIVEPRVPCPSSATLMICPRSMAYSKAFLTWVLRSSRWFGLLGLELKMKS
jgi:hypothetical protein